VLVTPVEAKQDFLTNFVWNCWSNACARSLWYLQQWLCYYYYFIFFIIIMHENYYCGI